MNEALKNIFWRKNQDAWIEGNATWVDLGYTPTNSTHVEFEIMFLGPATRFRDSQELHNIGTPDVIVGHMGTSDNNDWRIFSACAVDENGTYSITRMYVDIGSNRDFADLQADKRMYANVWYHVIIGQDKCHVDGIMDINLHAGTPAQTQTLKLFSENPASVSTNKPGSYAWLGFKYVKVFEGDTLMMDLIPYLDSGKACFINTLDGEKYFGLNKELIYHRKT